MSSSVELVLEARNIVKRYRAVSGKRRQLTVLDNISCQLAKRQTLGIIGESGCGKSTLAKIFMQIEPASGGELLINGQPYQELSLADFRPKIQMIFQDCYSSLNPRKKALNIVAEPLIVAGKYSKEECLVRAQEILTQVGLSREYWHRYPHMFSGGQRQRIGIARAIITRPQIVICDEPVSALDISVQAQIINLLLELQENYQLSYLVISHDLAVVSHIANTILVMYFGKVVEYGQVEEIFNHPQHPYSKALLDSTLTIGRQKDRPVLSGDLPSFYNPPAGCVFHSRCPLVKDICRQQIPELRTVQRRQVACHLL